MPQTFVLPRQRELDDDARPLAGALAYFFQTGTTTPQAVYSDAALTTQHQNPVPADSAGRWPKIYLNPGAPANYRVRLTTAAGVQIDQQDDIDRFTVSQAEIGQSLNPLTTQEDAAGITPADFAESYQNADRYSSLQYALDLLLSANGKIDLAKGATYAVGNTNLTLIRTESGDARRMIIDGNGAVLNFTGLTAGSALKVGADEVSNFVEGGELVIKNLTLQGPETGSTRDDDPVTDTVGLEIAFAGSVLLENVKCIGFKVGIKPKFAFPLTTINCSGRGSWVGILHDEASNQIEHIQFEAPNCRFGMVFKSDSTSLDDGKLNNIAIVKPWLEGCHVGIVFDSGSGGIGAVRYRSIEIYRPYVANVTYDVIRLARVYNFDEPETRGANCSEFINDFRLIGGIWNPTGGLWSATSAAICYDSAQRVRHAIVDIPVVSLESDAEVFVNTPAGGVVRTTAYPGISDAIITEYLYDGGGAIVRRFQPNGNIIFGSTKSTGGSITEAGAEVKNTGQIDAVADAAAAFRLGRNTSAGTVQAIYQDGALAGSIDTLSGDRIKINLNGAGTVFLMIGSGDPEGAVTASVGSSFFRTDGSTSTTLYVKTSGTGNTGWTAK